MIPNALISKGQLMKQMVFFYALPSLACLPASHQLRVPQTQVLTGLAQSITLVANDGFVVLGSYYRAKTESQNMGQSALSRSVGKRCQGQFWDGYQSEKMVSGTIVGDSCLESGRSMQAFRDISGPVSVVFQ